MKKVFVAGGVSYDRIIYMDTLPQGRAGSVFSSSSHDAVGGTGAGKALNLEKLGFDTTFHAFVGEDEEGKKIKDCFGKRDIKFDAEKDENSTLRFTNLIDKNGNRVSIFTAYNTFEPKLDMEKLKKYIAENEYIVLNIMNYARYLIPLAKEAGKEIWCDIHDYDGKNEYYKDFIEGADYIFMSSEVIEDYKCFMEELIKKGKKLVVCTHGKNGATAISSSGEVVEEGIIKKYEKVDTNGAGDSFFSGFLYGVAKGSGLKECMRYGTIAGGMCITSKELYSEELSSQKIEQEYKDYYLNRESHLKEEFKTVEINLGKESYILKKACIEDREELGKYFEELSAETRRRFGPHPLTKEEAEKICIGNIAKDDFRIVLKNRESGEIAAYFIVLFNIIIHEERRYREYGIELDGIKDATFAPSVADKMQDKKIASICMPYITEFLKKNGRRYFVLMGGTQSTNHRAVRFYEKFGFKRVGSYMTDIENYDMYMER